MQPAKTDRQIIRQFGRRETIIGKSHQILSIPTINMIEENDLNDLRILFILFALPKD